MGITVTFPVVTTAVCGNGLANVETLQIPQAFVIIGLTRVVETLSCFMARRVVGVWPFCGWRRRLCSWWTRN